MKGWPLGWGGQGNQPQGVGGSGGDGRQAQLSSGRDKSSQPDWGWGATVEMRRKASSKAGDPDWHEVAVLVMCKPEDSANGKGQQRPSPTPMVGGIRLDCSIKKLVAYPSVDRPMRISMVCKGSSLGLSFRCCPTGAAVEIPSPHGLSSYLSTLHFSKS